MKKLLIGLTILGIFLGGCQKKEEPKPVSQETQTAAQTTPAAANAMTEKVYAGILPCEDCPGVQTKIKISGKEGDTTGNVFELTRVYMVGNEPGNNSIMFRGNYIIQRGIEGDSSATVYILNPDKPKDEQEYYVIYSHDPTTMYPLDSDMKKIKSDLNYALKLTS